MHRFLPVLACLAHHAHASEVGKNIDDEDNTRAFAALLNAVHPSAAVMVPGGQQLMTTQKAAIVQGKSLKTWSYRSSIVDNVQVVLSTDGRPLDADVQLWQGPDNTPCKMRVYSEDGNKRPFSAVIATPDDGESTVAVRNVGENVFPLSAYVVANDVDMPFSEFRDTSTIVQGGGALRTYEFDSRVDSVEVMLKTDGRPLNARVELLEGPNNIKQVIELYTEDGLERPFFAIIDTKGMGNVIRVVNTAPIEFPMFASVEPHNINSQMKLAAPVVGGQKHVTGYDPKHVTAAYNSKHVTAYNNAVVPTSSTRSRQRQQSLSPVSAAMKGSARKLADLLNFLSEA